jgi:hypothetical protein
MRYLRLGSNILMNSRLLRCRRLSWRRYMRCWLRCRMRIGQRVVLGMPPLRWGWWGLSGSWHLLSYFGDRLCAHICLTLRGRLRGRMRSYLVVYKLCVGGGLWRHRRMRSIGLDICGHSVRRLGCGSFGSLVDGFLVRSSGDGWGCGLWLGNRDRGNWLRWLWRGLRLRLRLVHRRLLYRGGGSGSRGL